MSVYLLWSGYIFHAEGCLPKSIYTISIIAFRIPLVIPLLKIFFKKFCQLPFKEFIAKPTPIIGKGNLTALRKKFFSFCLRKSVNSAVMDGYRIGAHSVLINHMRHGNPAVLISSVCKQISDFLHINIFHFSVIFFFYFAFMAALAEHSTRYTKRNYQNKKNRNDKGIR